MRLKLYAFYHAHCGSPGLFFSADSVAFNTQSFTVTRARGWPTERGHLERWVCVCVYVHLCSEHSQSSPLLECFHQLIGGCMILLAVWTNLESKNESIPLRAHVKKPNFTAENNHVHRFCTKTVVASISHLSLCDNLRQLSLFSSLLLTSWQCLGVGVFWRIFLCKYWTINMVCCVISWTNSLEWKDRR